MGLLKKGLIDITDRLKSCPFCGGEIEERGGQCNYGKKIMTLDLMCRKCGTLFKFKSKWIENPYREAVESWNRRAGEEEKHETDYTMTGYNAILNSYYTPTGSSKTT